ncbi:DUF4190 domain-containing protein [Nocardioides sp. T2.26MG-1]|uniref:DUF4190 domain-containing protein n=1 Tax=Nocardioides sp. T2.26MG-1 TaxID=3041166 RepID=UPI002477BCCB|nr:DUF4190 domain-containing protein [Nocardioides sp. T2.26MG-1]CAI9419854.1 hypothetical protein HIDPHFAB_03901 [Nocardioides sp. T2.26MG-1]
MSYSEPPPPPQYGVPVPPQGGLPPKTAGKAIASMVTGLVGLLTICCGFFVITSIVGLVLGILARKEIRASNGQLKGEGMALTGIITGVIGILMVVVTIILVATGVIDTNFEYSTS